MNVVWFAEIKWDYLRTRKQQLIRRRPPDVDVLFLEPFVRGRENLYDLRPVDGIRAVTIPFIKNIPAGPGRGALNLPMTRYIVDASARARVRGQLRRAGIEPRDAVFIISNVYAIHVAASFATRRLVYDCNDAHADFPGMPAWTHRYQEETLRCADRVIVSARRLGDDAERVRGRKEDICLVGNGVDHAAFRAALALRPRGMRERPRIGYLGAIAPWFDFELVGTLAEMRPGWDFTLVGPVLPGAGPAVERLASRSNVAVKPAVAHDDVPRVLSEFDVGLIPFRINTLTTRVNPNKLYEYLAAGLPVVSTPFSDDVVETPGMVARAGDAAAFSRACEDMLSLRRGSDARDRLANNASELAAGHDWDRIAREFWACACG